MTDRRSAPPKSTNQKSILLNAEENNRLFGLIGQKRFTLASAVVQLVTADPPHFNTWVKKCCGVATFIKDNGKRTYFICVYDLKSGQCLWTQELYNQFTYHAVEDYFHYFEAHDCPAGLNFANEDEANLFRKAVLDKLAERKARREEKRRTQAHGLDSSRVPNYQPPPPPPSQNANNFSSTTNQFGPKVTSGNMTVKGKKDKDKDKKGKIKKEDISNPTNFTHVQHMGWDASGTMQETAIDLKDPDLIQLFQRVNVYDITTLDPNFVQDFVKKSGGMDAVRNDNKRYGSTRPTAPAPPPVVPPAPPRSMSVSAAPPPPPPSSAPAPAPPPRTLQQPAPAPQAPPPQPPSRPPPGPPELPSAPPSRARHVAPAAPSALRPKNPPARPPPGPPPAPPSGAFSSAPPPPPPPIGAPPPPPPPPPPPAANNAPLPPPPPSISMPSVDDSGRGDLLASIRAGAKLKTVTATDAPAAPTDARSNLLSDIVNKGSKTLRAVDQTIKVEAPQEEDTGLAGALARALKDRQAKMTGDDDDDSQSEEDDAEWDD